MLAHLILTLTLLLSREENVKACLPFDYTQDEYDRKDVELAAGLGVAVGLLVTIQFNYIYLSLNILYNWPRYSFCTIYKLYFDDSALGHRNVWILIRHFNVFTFRGSHLHRSSLIGSRLSRLLLSGRLGLQPRKLNDQT